MPDKKSKEDQAKVAKEIEELRQAEPNELTDEMLDSVAGGHTDGVVHTNNGHTDGVIHTDSSQPDDESSA